MLNRINKGRTLLRPCRDNIRVDALFVLFKVFHCFNHDFMLAFRVIDLHTTRTTNRRVRHIAIPADFVAGIHNYHTAFFCQHTRGLT